MRNKQPQKNFLQRRRGHTSGTDAQKKALYLKNSKVRRLKMRRAADKCEEPEKVG